MRRKLSVLLTLSALAFSLIFSLAAPVPRAQDSQQSGIINDFINSRGITFDAPPSRPRRRPRRKPPAPGTPRARKPPAQGTNTNAPDHVVEAKRTPTASTPQEASEGDDDEATPGMQPAAAHPIALGYTLAMEDANGAPVVIDESREFKFGDSIRLLLEPNTNGYLYIFQTQEGVQPQMLYPHAALDDGRNRVGAHTRETVPAESWYTFGPPAGTLRVYVILSRKPLEGVPTGDELIALCGGPRDECLWEPKPSEWERIKAAASTGAVEERNPLLAGARILLSDESFTRGLRLKKESPAPAVVRVNSSPSANVLTTVITLACR
ncbi:MAG TPA: DUF4384 domain-containing protein [Pyrinomonadaceae bacterium]|nr:DUF4384 domain-containing protein [Pyrinomonadaceae bacterium]